MFGLNPNRKKPEIKKTTVKVPVTQLPARSTPTTNGTNGANGHLKVPASKQSHATNGLERTRRSKHSTSRSPAPRKRKVSEAQQLWGGDDDDEEVANGTAKKARSDSARHSLAGSLEPDTARSLRETAPWTERDAKRLPLISGADLVTSKPEAFVSAFEGVDPPATVELQYPGDAPPER